LQPSRVPVGVRTLGCETRHCADASGASVCTLHTMSGGSASCASGSSAARRSWRASYNRSHANIVGSDRYVRGGVKPCREKVFQWRVTAGAQTFPQQCLFRARPHAHLSPSACRLGPFTGKGFASQASVAPLCFPLVRSHDRRPTGAGRTPLVHPGKREGRAYRLIPFLSS
jgi:hypothetical protein